MYLTSNQKEILIETARKFGYLETARNIPAIRIINTRTEYKEIRGIDLLTSCPFSYENLLSKAFFAISEGNMEKAELLLAKCQDIDEDYEFSGAWGFSKRKCRNHLKRLITPSKY